MHIIELILHKRNGGELSTEQINWFIEQYTQNNIPDYQAAAWCMAIYFVGMTRREISDLTKAMARSGDQIDLSDVLPFAIDKHSSGGVGDKTTLVVLPIVAACGVPVAKMSGRGLGHTGGTLDKLESIRGYQVELPMWRFKQLAQLNKIVLAGQSADLAPADKALYALRDVTATIDSLPLIASSIMSKKLAAGTDAIVLDVKAGVGAFMKTEESACELAQIMVNIGVDAGRHMVALISDMNQPLGVTAGLALEVKEALATLHGGGPADFREHCLEVASHMLHIAPNSGAATLEEARQMAEQSLQDETAFHAFRQMVAGQGGDVTQVDDPDLLPTATITKPYPALQDGYISQLNALDVGMAVLRLGGGRETKTDPIDHAVGVETHRKVGDWVKAGDTIFTLHANDETRLEDAQERLDDALTISTESVQPLPLFYDTITGTPED